MIDSQRDVRRFMLRHGLRYDAATHTLDLISELGELSKLVVEATDYGQRALDDDGTFSTELGDVFYSLLALAVALNVDAGEALDAAMQKYERRLREHGGPGSAS